jgi:acetoin utilization deacetylase AcuC-like enzyme
MNVNKEGFALLTRIVMELAELSAKGKVVVSLEGGYHLEGLRESGKAVLKELIGESIIKEKEKDIEEKADNRIDSLIHAVTDQIKPYWGEALCED